MGKWGAPLCTDWDGDGLQDLLVGQYHWGVIRLYLNVNTAAAPEFSGYTYLFADGEILSVTWY